MNKFDLGILGGGQLGMFICQAAKKLNLSTVVLSQSKNFSAKNFCDLYLIGDYNDDNILKNFLHSSDNFTIETENIPKQVLRKIEKEKKLFPSSKIIEISQNRLKEKKFLNSLKNIRTAKFKSLNNFSDLKKSLKIIGNKGILKSCEFGYDGKGQYFVNESNLDDYKSLNFQNYILEEILDFKKEISVIVSRTKENYSYYPPVENLHKNSILRKTIYPAKINDLTNDMAIQMALKISENLDLIGLLAIEMFVMKDNSIIINELAPRPHNSGHWSMDFCKYSQYQNLLFAIFNKKVKDPKPFRSGTMINVIGEDYKQKEKFKKIYKFYDYYKNEIKPLRKMAHYTTTN
tara:strand:- start:330 stop:1370 length:1041 start_codon:yes stop_codon:yes gene_type:complete